MEALIIEPADDIPNIVLDLKNNEYKISGVSTPENAFELYNQAIVWLDNAESEITKPIRFVFDFKYLSSSSHKMVFDILNKLEKMAASGKEVKVIWIYKEVDEDMMELGEDFSELVKLPFELQTKD